MVAQSLLNTTSRAIYTAMDKKMELKTRLLLVKLNLGLTRF
ncbi:hypothetical protein QRE63_30575 (plasmid) [Bacillus mycoides]|nr:hypothetical protein QRE63_30575 [Bacillus mycoides]